jgi:hypothetical protein
MVSAGSMTIFAAGMGLTLLDSLGRRALRRHDCLEIAALGTRAAYNKLRFKSHLQVLMGSFAVSRLNFLEDNSAAR